MKKLYTTILVLFALSCEDQYLTVERRVVDAENNIPIYFNTYAEQDGLNTWRPVFTYYIYQMEEGEYDAYFHAYVMIDDSIISQETIIIDTQSTDSVKGILEESNLSRLFFSPQNIEALHSMIRYYVHKMTDGKVVSKQSPDELFIVMRSILLQDLKI